MKKNFLLLLLCVVPFISFAQDVLTVDSVVTVPNKNADEIYSAISKWLATNVDVQSAQAVVTSDDEKRSTTTKAVFKFEVKNMTWYAMSGVISCTVDVTARDGRYRIRFSNFVHDSSTPDQVTGTWDEGLLYSEIPQGRTKGVRGRQHKEVYKRAGKRIQEWTDSQIAALTSYINSFTNIEDEDW